MNKCCHCKHSVSTWQKLRCMWLQKAEYCPNCRAELSLFSLWALLGFIFILFGPIAITAYLSKNTQIFDGWLLLTLTWTFLTLLSLWLTALFLPLVPYKDRVWPLVVLFICTILMPLSVMVYQIFTTFF